MVFRRAVLILVVVLSSSMIYQSTPALAAPSEVGDSAHLLSHEMLPKTVEQVSPRMVEQSVIAEHAVERQTVANAPQSDHETQYYRQQKESARYGPAPTGAGTAQSVQSFGQALQPAASLPLVFNGLQAPGNTSPPDTIAAGSQSRVIEGVNRQLRLSDGANGAAIDTQTLNTFFGTPVANGLLFDPKVYFDRNSASPRFYITALVARGQDDNNNANNASSVLLAVARNQEPANLSNPNWCFYTFQGQTDPATSEAGWADYPMIGAGQDSFTISTNHFRFTDRAFKRARLLVFNKSDLEACRGVRTFTFFPSNVAGDFSHFAIQPAQHYDFTSSFPGTTNPVYLMSTDRGSNNRYHVYRVRNVASGAPSLHEIVLTGTSYGFPPSSPQPNSAVLVNTGDNRVMQVTGNRNEVWGIFATVCNFVAGTPNESCTLSPRVVVGQNAAGAFTANIVENVFWGFGDSIFVSYPSIARNGNIAVSTWQISGATTSLSATAQLKTVNVGGWGGVGVFAPGSCSLPATPPSTTVVRAGDYTGAHTHPDVNNPRFWMAGEQAIIINGTCQWRTRVARLHP